MAFIQNVAIPTQQIQQFDINNYNGGLNNVVSPLRLRPNESPNLMNVITYDEGVAETRPGIFKYILEQIPETIYHVFLFSTPSFEYFLLSGQTNLYRVPVVGGTVEIVCATHQVISGVQYEEKFYFVDGEKYREYDGTTVNEIIDPVTESDKARAGTASGIQLASAANVNNDYYNGWFIYIISGTGNGQSNIIDDYTGADKLCTVRNAWVTQPDSTSLYYITQYEAGINHVDTINHTVTYTPTDKQFVDTFMGTNNISMSKVCSMMINHKQRMVLAGDTNHKNIVYYSQTDNPYYIPTNQWIPPVTNNDDYITALFSFNDVLLMFKQHTLFALYGYDETDFDLKEVTVGSGTICPDAICKSDNQLIYFGFDGRIYVLVDVRTDYKKMLTKDISGDKIDLNKEPINLFPKDCTNAKAVYYQGRYFLAVGDKILVYRVGGGWVVWNHLVPTVLFKYENDILLSTSDKYLYRLTLNRFYVTETFTAIQDQTDFTLQKGYINEINSDVTVTINGTSITDIIKYSNKIFQVPKCNVGDTVRIEYLSLLSYNDNGEGYLSYIETPDLYYGIISKSKQLRNIFITADTFKYFTSILNVKVFIDYYDVSSGVKIENQIALWDVATWDVSRFIDRNIVEPQPVIINRRGKIIRYRIENDQPDQPFRLFSISGQVTIRER